jgi:hypothetical protein
MFELRALLPDKLVNPTRTILQSSNRSPPEKLAAQLKGAAVAGSRDIQRFKLNYHSDAMRELFQTVNAAEIPQGQDAWFTDYIALLKDIKAKETQGETCASNTQSIATDETPSDRDVIKHFREAHPDVEISVQDETLGLPLSLKASPLNFRVDRAEDRGKQAYSIELEEDGKQTQLAKEVIRYVQAKHVDESLPAMLVRYTL